MPTLPPFKLERFFAQYEFSVRYLLSASDCEALTLAEVLALAEPAARERWENLRLSYTESQGDPELRAAIAGLHPGLKPEEVAVLVPEEGIFVLMQTLLRPGDHVITIHPAYQSLHEIARALGCEVTPWPVLPSADGRSWQVDVDALAAAITPRTRLLVVNFPHNPTGFLPAADEVQAIIELARRHGLYVFSDEMYRLLEYDPARRLPPVAATYERGISLSGLSKTFGLPGLRLGWLSSRAPGVIEQCVAFKDYTTICHSAPSEILGLMALRAADAIRARNLGIIEGNLAAADDFFERHADRFAWPRPHAGSVAFPEWRGPGSVEALYEALLDEEGVLLVPGGLFDVPGNRFRLGLGRRNFAAGLARFDAFLARRRNAAHGR